MNREDMEQHGLTLSKLARVLNRNLTLNLVDPELNEAYYYGSVKNIPVRYECWKAVDILGVNGWVCTMVIEK